MNANLEKEKNKGIFGIPTKLAQNGDEEAFKEIFEKLCDKLFFYCLSRTPNRDEALDVVQEAFVDLWLALKKFKYKSDDQFLGFVFIILKRKLYKTYRKTRKTEEIDENMIEASYEMETEDYRHLFGSMETLAEKYKEILRLRYWSEMSFQEISSVLKIKETTAKVLHHRAIKKLQTIMPQTT